MSLLKELNDRYIAVHRSKEDAFWQQKMGLAGTVEGDFEKKELALKDFTSDPEPLQRIREELKRDDLSEHERVGLEGWRHFFEVNIIEREEAKESLKRVVDLEGKLERARRDMPLGYIDPQSGEQKRTGSVALALMIQTAGEEPMRKAAWEGLRSIEPYVLDHGFIEVVKERNRLAKLLGYQDYYDYKVSINEGFGKEKLFELLDELEQNTREACRKAVEQLAAEKGENAIQPWNMDFNTSGDITTLTNPYFPFERSLEVWGRSFAALGIRYNGSTLQLDLVDRKGKYENGFMHGTFPAYVNEEGTFQPARINFTANAVPGQMGSGKSAIRTLLHEGGHAAHFSNIMMPAPCFSQEFAPTSVAFAETQSMFLDSLLGDADWLTRYARNQAGEAMPLDLIHRSLESTHKYRAHRLRKMLCVPYAEKAIYEMSDDELTPENILRELRNIEARLLFQPAGSRPILSIPHLLSGESSAYYHGYILAEMAVYQTRDYFMKKYGRIMDNPKVGEELTVNYWRPGNSKTFLEMVNDLTGEPFSAKATVALVNRSLEDVFADADRMAAEAADMGAPGGPIDLEAVISVVHGDTVIGSTADGSSFEELSGKFAAWIGELEEAATLQ